MDDADVTKRVNQAVERILENERLTADLDDEVAEALVEWGVAWAEMIARSSAGLDDLAAEEVTSPKERALRRLMRRVNKWVAQLPAAAQPEAAQERDQGWWRSLWSRRADKEPQKEPQIDVAAHTEPLNKVIEQAAIIYGDNFAPPEGVQLVTFLQQNLGLDNRAQLITNLRRFIENRQT